MSKKVKRILYILIILGLIINTYLFVYKPVTKVKENNTTEAELFQMSILNPEIVNTEFQKIGKLIVSEGRTTYKNSIVDKNWYSEKSLTYEFTYRYGIGIDLSKLTIESIADNIVSVNIPVYELKIEYLEILPNETKINSQKTLLASQFKPDIMKTIIQTSEQDVYTSIRDNKDIQTESLKNLQDNISNIVKQLGFKDCYFKLIIK